MNRLCASAEPMQSAIFFDSSCLEGRSGLPSDALDHVIKGGVVVFKRGLHEIGFADRLSDQTLAEIQVHVLPEQLEQVKKVGFERLHEALSPQQIYDLNVNLTEKFRSEIGLLIRSFSSHLLGYTGRVFVYGLPVVRFFVPHDLFAANRQLFSKRKGFLQIQGPHHDSWFDHATESLNVWIAVGRVRRGNGLIVYPDHCQGRISHNGTRSMPKDQRLGRGISFDLDPGDIVFFHGETLHSSELNVTDETRYVITNRFTLQKPRFTQHEQWHAWYDSALLGTPWEWLARWPTYFSRDYLLHLVKRRPLLVRRLKQWLPWLFSERQSSATPASFTEQPPRSVSENSENEEDMAVGEIRAVTADQCKLRTENGVVSFARFCPHEGADLAGAVYENGRIRCPWHHLSFDAQTGEQPCHTLSHLKMYSVNVERPPEELDRS